MLARVRSCSIWGIDAFPIDVEVDIGRGLPGVAVVGLPDQAVKESRDRIKPAIRNSGFKFPSHKIIINLAPADIKKEGASFDLAMALGMLAAGGDVSLPRLADYFFVGELALDGSLRAVNGVLPMAMRLRAEAVKKLIVPAENAAEASVVDGIEVIPVRNLAECVGFLQGTIELQPHRQDVERLFSARRDDGPDFREVKGQSYAKRALEVAVSGFHNIMMVGAPGAGKSMLASRIPGILPSLTLDEALEITRIHSVSGMLKERRGLVVERPFRAPHHTVSGIALTGGGAIPKPGEVSLAHNGVLFLDELPEFHRDVLEALRQPLEDRHIGVSRVRGKTEFPCRFLFVAAMNPCPCGWYGDQQHSCRCTVPKILKYRSKISGPLLDRIDIHIEVSSLPPGLLVRERDEESSAEIRTRVDRARKIQAERFSGDECFFNGQMKTADIKKYCVMTPKAKELLEQAISAMRFSGRAYDKVRKLGRTIADMEGAATIDIPHISEAIQYRALDREDW